MNAFIKDLVGATIQSILEGEMSNHLGYQKHDSTGDNSGNSRNGYSKKTIKTKHGEVPLDVRASMKFIPHKLKDKSSTGGYRELIIAPDVQGDFTNLQFPARTFALVVFDPPHLTGNGSSGWLAKKYGKLGVDWKAELRQGFSECFRVLRPDGTLIFKWSEEKIPVSQILALTPVKPLFGNRCGKSAKTHWIVFMKRPNETT